MNVLLTCGPSFEPIDPNRRLASASTGELGTLLAETLSEVGHRVTCFRSIIASYPAPLYPVRVVPFTTNADLEKQLRALADRITYSVVLHGAALSEFRIGLVETETGQPLPPGTPITGKVRITLEPVPSLVASLRQIFPGSVLICWNHQATGTLNELMNRGRDQMETCLTDSAVLLGAAYGRGYGVLSRAGERVHLPDKVALCNFIKDLLDKIPHVGSMQGQESFHALASLMPLAPFI